MISGRPLRRSAIHTSIVPGLMVVGVTVPWVRFRTTSSRTLDRPAWSSRVPMSRWMFALVMVVLRVATVRTGGVKRYAVFNRRTTCRRSAGCAAPAPPPRA